MFVFFEISQIFFVASLICTTGRDLLRTGTYGIMIVLFLKMWLLFLSFASCVIF